MMFAVVRASSQRELQGTRVLFDLVHPANVLFFYHSVKELIAAGAEVRIVSRHKDVLTPLLDEFGFEHTPITRAGDGRAQLGRELLQRDWRLWKVARSFRPHVMVGFGGVAISHVGKLTGIPSISFYDTEHARLQVRLALPFISEWHVPESWGGLEAKGRTFRFPGGKAFAYLHPDRFVPSAEIAAAAGWDASCDNFLVRTVVWRAAHDAGRSGLSSETLREIVSHLGKRGKVHISAEGDLPRDLEPMRYRGTSAQFHHLLAHCRLYCGESITIASEAVMLGVLVLLQIDKEYCYVTEQEDAGLIRRLRSGEAVADALTATLAQDRKSYRARSREFIRSKGDVNRYVLEQIVRVANGEMAAKGRQ
jgi:predicted glycosyltransferase